MEKNEDNPKEQKEVPFVAKEPEVFTNEFKGKSIEEINEESIHDSLLKPEARVM